MAREVEHGGWPRLPRSVEGLAGRIRVLRPAKVFSSENGDCWGDWAGESRLIRVRATLPREVAWHTLLHEVVHAAMSDTGLELADPLAESICDTVASAMVRLIHTSFIK